MSDKSGIAWTDATWNPTTGCTKVSPGCKYCYAKHQAWPRLAAMKTGVYSGRVFEDVQVHPERLDQPLRWTKPRMIFVNSMSDLFHEDIPDQFIAKVFGVMTMAPQHIFQILTKRPLRMMQFMQRPGRVIPLPVGMRPPKEYRWPLPNVWLGVSVENQETADERIPLLLETPAAVRWLSCEPLIGPMSLIARDRRDGVWHGDGWLRRLSWVVVGGESGPKARPMDISWALDIRNQCGRASVPFFMKQGSQANWPHWKDISKWIVPLQVQEYPEGHQ